MVQHGVNNQSVGLPGEPVEERKPREQKVGSSCMGNGYVKEVKSIQPPTNPVDSVTDRMIPRDPSVIVWYGNQLTSDSTTESTTVTFRETTWNHYKSYLSYKVGIKGLLQDVKEVSDGSVSSIPL